jgi:hypothetical protein
VGKSRTVLYVQYCRMRGGKGYSKTDSCIEHMARQYSQSDLAKF